MMLLERRCVPQRPLKTALSRGRYVTCASAGGNQTAKLFFSVPKKVAFGCSVGLVGSTESAGNWDPNKGLDLIWNDNDSWSGELEAPAGQQIEYKFFTRNPDGIVDEWQPGNNLILDVPDDQNAVLLVTDDWQGRERIVSVQSEEAVKRESPLPSQSAANERADGSTSQKKATLNRHKLEEPGSASEASPPPPKELHFQTSQSRTSDQNGRQGVSSLQYDAAVQTGVSANGSAPQPEGQTSAEGEELDVPTADELETLKVKELKALLKERDLPVTGRKADLLQRLREGWTSILKQS